MQTMIVPQGLPALYKHPRFQQFKHRAGARQAQSQHSTVTMALHGEHTAGLESFHGKTEKQYSILTENGESLLSLFNASWAFLVIPACLSTGASAGPGTACCSAKRVFGSRG